MVIGHIFFSATKNSFTIICFSKNYSLKGFHMRFMMFKYNGAAHFGVLHGNHVINMQACDANFPTTLHELIVSGADALSRLKAAINNPHKGTLLSLDDVTPALPIARPRKFICVVLNYAARAREGGHKIPQYPSLFVRWPSSLVACGAPVIMPQASDY